MLPEAEHGNECPWELLGMAIGRGNREPEPGIQHKESLLVRWEAGMFETILQGLVR